jgi:tetratricopeptide (TPR) repeat protein
VTLNLLATFYSEDYYFQVAESHLERQDFAGALLTLDAGRKKFTANAQLELATGVAYYGLRRFPEAIESFLRTIQLDSSIEQPYTFLGRMLDQSEARLPAIRQAFAAFAVHAPANYVSSFLYGKALALGDEPTRAEPLLRKSIAQNGSYWESHFELGLLLDRQRKYEEAAGEMHRAAELNPRDPVPHYHLARLYDRLGKPAEAAAEREAHARLAAAAAPAGYGMPGIK